MKKLTAIGIVCLAFGIWLEGLAVENHFKIINYMDSFPELCSGCIPPPNFPVPLIVVGAVLLVSGPSMLLLGCRKKPVEINDPK